MIHHFLVTQTVTMIDVTIVQVLYSVQNITNLILSVSQGTIHSIASSRPLVLCQT